MLRCDTSSRVAPADEGRHGARPRRRLRRGLCLLLLGPAFLLCSCGGSGSDDTSVSGKSSEQQEALVSGRAKQQTQQDAKGLTIPRGALQIAVGDHTVKISAEDWNTIVASSIVRLDVGVAVDPEFHAGPTGRNRFQYLADRLVEYAGNDFRPISIGSFPQGKGLASLVALINPTAAVYKLTGLKVSVAEQGASSPLGQATFYPEAGQGLVLPARTVYFRYLQLPLLGSPPKDLNQIETSFRWDRSS